MAPLILIDDREDLRVLLPLFPNGTGTEVVRLDSGDFAFSGNGPEGRASRQIGLERKTFQQYVVDAQSGRLGDQIDRMMRAYHHYYLLIEGSWRVLGTGQVACHEWHHDGMATPPGFRTILGQLNTELWHGGTRFVRTLDPVETVMFVTACHSWWTHEDWDDHRSHLKPYVPPPGFKRPSALRVFIAGLRDANYKKIGIGWTISKAVDDHFKGSIRAAVNANEAEWATIPGIGPTIAHRVVTTVARKESQA